MKRVGTYSLYKKTKTSFINTGLSLLLLASSLGGTVPLILSQHVSAAPGLVYSSSFADLDFAPDRQTPSGGYTPTSNQLDLRVDNTHANTSSTFYQTEGVQSAIPASRSISARLFIDPAWAGKPVRAGMWGVASSSTAGDLAYPIIEYTNVGGYTGWRVFDTINGGWTNLPAADITAGSHMVEIAFNAATRNYDYYVGGTKVASLPAVDTTVTPNNVYGNFQAVIFNNYNSATNDHAQDYAVTWKGFRTGQAPMTAACSNPTSVHTTNFASTWNTSETRATGHNELLANALHVYTEGATSTDKAAAYYPANFPLSAAGNKTIAQSFDYTTNSGTIPPGLQLVIDFDHNGAPDATLVGEKVYGNTWWLTNGSAQFAKDGAPHTGGGFGSNWFGTLDEWLSSFPDAQVTNIGYSLGSGVKGDYTINHINLGCTDYTFGLAAPSNLKPVDGTYTNDPAFVDSWNVVEGAAGYEYRTSNSKNGTDLGPIIYSDSTLSQPGRYSTAGNTVTRQNGGTPENVYFWQVRAVDSNGDGGPWSGINKVTVDTTAPAAIQNVSPANNSTVNTHDFTFDWTDSTDANPVTYSWEASLSNATNVDGGFTSVLASHTLSASQVASPGTPDNVYYWHVKAVDAAGNATAWTPTWKVTVDTNAPATPTNLSWKTSANVTVANGGITNLVGGTAQWDETSSDVDHYVYRYWNDIPGNPYKVGSEYTTNTGGTSLAGVFNQGEGVHHFTVQAVDAGGNLSAVSDTFTITYDATAPAGLANVSPADGTVSTTAAAQLITWTEATDANGPVKYFYEASTSNLVNGDGSFFSPVYQSPALNDHQIPTPNTPAGTYYWHVRAVDAAGNSTDWTGAWKIIVDNTAPAVTVNTLSTTDTTPTVTGTVDDSTATVKATVNGQVYTATVTGNTWSVDVTNALAVGTYDVAAAATDAAGNVGTDTTSNELTITAPAVLGSNTGSTNNSNVTVTSTSTQNASTGNANNSGNGSAGPAQSGDASNSNDTNINASVLGDSTNVPNTDSDNTEVKTIADVSAQNNKFLGLGYWWILVLAAIAGFFWFLLAAKRRNDDNA